MCQPGCGFCARKARNDEAQGCMIWASTAIHTFYSALRTSVCALWWAYLTTLWVSFGPLVPTPSSAHWYKLEFILLDSRDPPASAWAVLGAQVHTPLWRAKCRALSRGRKQIVLPLWPAMDQSSLSSIYVPEKPGHELPPAEPTAHFSHSS